MFVYAALLFYRRRKLKKMVADMEKRKVGGTVIYVTKTPVTPSTVGVFRPKIVMPEVILKEYDQMEFQTILLHEKTHIRLGHLLFYLLWDILRVLLWLNPLLAIGIKYFREDMEEICDWVTIKRSEGKAYAYGQLLLKSMRILQAESEDFNMYATFAGDKEYQNIRHRVKKIAGYKPYKRGMTVCIGAVSIICVVISIFYLQKFSYDRFCDNSSISIFGMNDRDILLVDDEGKIISHDKQYIYIDMDALQTVFYENGIEEQILFIYCGGFVKLPGIGIGGGFGYVYEENYAGGIQRIPYEDTEDVWTTLLKII